MAASLTIESRAGALLAEGRTEQAITLVTGAAQAGDAAACRLLGIWRLVGAPVTRDLAQARALLRTSADGGDIDAAFMDIALSANGSGEAVDWLGGRRRLQSIAPVDATANAQHDWIARSALDDRGYPLATPPLAILSNDPFVAVCPRFLDPLECRTIAESAAELLEPSRVFDPKTGGQIVNPVRTSLAAVIGPTRENLVIAAVLRRIAAVTATGLAQGEPLSLLRYTDGQQYRLHHDAIAGAANQRIKTVIMYLNDDFAGGATVFPELGLTITPRIGDALIFDNVKTGMDVDQRTRHAGLPVSSGAKWVATRWIRAEAFSPWTDG